LRTKKRIAIIEMPASPHFVHAIVALILTNLPETTIGF